MDNENILNEFSELLTKNVFPYNTKVDDTTIETFGITKRELFAAMAMQGIFSNNNLLLATMQGMGTDDPCKAAAYLAKESANELINQLEQ